MKNIFKLFAIVAMGLFATSCANDLTDDLQVNGGEVEVSFTTGLPSRAISDGKKATKLYVQAYAVQDNGTTVNLKMADSAEAVVAGLKATVNLRFVQGMTYKVVFWAQHPSLEGPTFDDNEAEVEIDYSKANDENRDAFYAVVDSLYINGPATHNVELYRPFAQLNVATNDLAEAQDLGFELQNVTVKAYAYNELNLLTGEPIGNLEEVTFPAAVLSGEKLNGNDWLSFNYLLVDDEQHTLPEVVVTIAQNYGNPRIITEYAVPVQRNYRTNLVGALLTTTNGFNVELVPAIKDIDYEVADLAASVTDLQSKVDALADSSEVRYDVLAALSGDNSLTIKNNLTNGDLGLDFAAVEAGATLTINDESDQYTGKVTIVVPDSMSSSEALSALTIDLPRATVEVIGAFGTITATTADNTLVIAEGATVDKIVAVKGNVVIYGTVTTIEKGASYDGIVTKYIKEAAELSIASGVDKFILENDIAVAADTVIEIASGKSITIDLNGKTLSSTNTRTNTHNDFILVKGTLNVQNGTITYEHTGTNMGWNGCTNLLDITAGGVANLNGVVANNLGGTDMNFAAHLNNWGTVTLNADNCEFLSTYCGVRLFNSGYDMNDVTISNSKLTGATRAFWVHNFTNEGKDSSTLKVDIFNRGNIFEISGEAVSPIRYGFTNASYYIIAEDGSIYFQTPDAVTISSYNVTEDDVVLPNEVNGIPVTVLGGYLFDSKTLNSVVLPNNVEVIGNRAFKKTTIKSGEVILPNTVTTLEEGAFQGATHTTITIPENVTYIGKQSIGYSSTLETIIIKAKNPTICNYVARSCANLKSVYIYSDDVTFDTGSMYFTNKENADASAITFYVNGQALADKLFAAMSTSSSYGLKIVSLDGATTYYNTLK